MGGSGSGYYFRARRRRWYTEEHKRIDAVALPKGHWRVGSTAHMPYSCDGVHIGNVTYTLAEGAVRLWCKPFDQGRCTWDDGEQTITVAWTPTHFGGRRAWFLCPSCGRRARTLYASNRFFCRLCLGLRYQSQNESRLDRQLSKAIKINLRLGGTGCLDDGPPPKPRRMHWRTYNRLVNVCEKAAAMFLM